MRNAFSNRHIFLCTAWPYAQGLFSQSQASWVYGQRKRMHTVASLPNAKTLPFSTMGRVKEPTSVGTDEHCDRPFLRIGGQKRVPFAIADQFDPCRSWSSTSFASSSNVHLLAGFLFFLYVVLSVDQCNGCYDCFSSDCFNHSGESSINTFMS